MLNEQIDAYNAVYAKLDQACRSGAYGIADAAIVVRATDTLTEFFSSSPAQIITKLAAFPTQGEADEWGAEEQMNEPEIIEHSEQEKELPKTIDAQTVPGTGHRIAKPKPQQ